MYPHDLFIRMFIRMIHPRFEVKRLYQCKESMCKSRYLKYRSSTNLHFMSCFCVGPGALRIPGIIIGNMADLKPVTHVIFDLDGVLLDTEKKYFEMREKLCKKYNKEYTLEFHADTSGVRGLEACELIVSKLQLPLTAQEFYDQTRELYREEFSSAILKPGAERLIRHLHAHKIPMAVATSSSREHIELKFTNHKDLFSLMDHIVSGTSDEEVKKGKPAPDIFLVCASKFCDNPMPEKVLVFEDAPNGVLAARAAGMQVVMVPEDHIPQEKRTQATLVISSLDIFQPELFGLPRF